MSTADKPVGAHATPTDITSAPSETSAAPASAPAAVTERPGTGPDQDAIKLPPHQPRVSAPGGVSTLVRLFDAVLVVLVLALAVFVAARPVRESDVLRHLGTGRALVEGRYNPLAAKDPFAATTEGLRWVNPSWLYDVVSYGLYSLAERMHEGTGILALSVLHALLVAILALVLVRIGRGAGGPIVSILCVMLALLVMAPQVRVDPSVVSLFFLGLTLWLLQRGGRRLEVSGRGAGAAPGEPLTWKDYWLLLPLFALWANLDEWFFLGPLTVGLYALGQSLQPRSTPQQSGARTPRPGEVPALGVIFVAGLVACLLNPHHVFVFALPDALGFSGAAGKLQEAKLLGETYTLPLQAPFLPGRLSVVGLAYFALILFGLISFGLNYKGLRWWRVLLFGFFLLLSAVAVRAVPFFAVVAGLVLALNFQDLAERRQAAQAGRGRSELALGRVLAALTLLLLLAAGWSGRLHAEPYEEHRVCFANELDPSFKQTGEWIKEQREKGLLDKGFVLSPDLADALALYCPEEKGFLDHRYRLFGEDVANEFLAVRNALLQTRGPEAKDWQPVLEKYHIDHVVLHAPEAEGLLIAYRTLTLEPRGKEPKEWVELYRDGRTVVFGWRKKRKDYDEHRLDVERLAYSPAAVNKVSQEGMPYLPGSQSPWMTLLTSAGPRSLESDEAALHLLAFEVEALRKKHEREVAMRAALAAGALAEVQLGPVPMAPATLLGPSLGQAYEAVKQGKRLPAENPLAEGGILVHGRFQRSFDSASPAHLLQAVRAARRALAKNPDDAHAHLQLGKAYKYLSVETRERTWDPNRALLGDLRYIQAVASYNQAVLLDPHLVGAHGGLIQLYEKLPAFLDLELRQYQELLKATRFNGRGPLESAEDFEKRVEGLAKAVDEMAQVVDKQQVQFENRKKRLVRALDRANEALNHHLAGEALKILRDSSVDDFGPEGMRMQIELGLRTGLVRDVHTWFDLDAEEEKKFIANLVQPKETLQEGFGRYYRFKGLLAGATGEYALADRCFGEIETKLDQALNQFDLDQYLLRYRFGSVLREKDLPVIGASAAGLLGSPLGQGPLLAASTISDARPEVKSESSPVVAIKEALALTLARSLLEETTPSQSFVEMMDAGARVKERQQAISYLLSLRSAIIDRAQHCALRGVLALEAGEVARAEQIFRDSLRDWEATPRNGSALGFDFPYRLMAQEYLLKLRTYK